MQSVPLMWHSLCLLVGSLVRHVATQPGHADESRNFTSTTYACCMSERMRWIGCSNCTLPMHLEGRHDPVATLYTACSLLHSYLLPSQSPRDEGRGARHVMTC
eukprot:351893-Chlamydomonas_euryale.AAC.4